MSTQTPNFNSQQTKFTERSHSYDLPLQSQSKESMLCKNDTQASMNPSKIKPSLSRKRIGTITQKIDKLLAVFEAAGCDLKQQTYDLRTWDQLTNFQNQCDTIVNYMDLARQQIKITVQKMQNDLLTYSDKLTNMKNKKQYYKQKCRQLQQAM